MTPRRFDLEAMKSFVAKMPELERKVPLVKVGDRYLSGEEVLAGWADVEIREAAVRLVGSLAAPNANLTESLGEEFIIHRIQVKFGLGMVSPFLMIPKSKAQAQCPTGRRVDPKQLMRHLSRRDKIGVMRIQAERKLLAELAKLTMGMGGGS